MVTSAEDILEEYAENPKFKFDLQANISTKDPVQKKILDILDKRGELSGDEIIRELGVEASQVITELSRLEIKNKIREKNGRYQKT